MYTVIQAEFTKNRKKDKYGCLKLKDVFVMKAKDAGDLKRYFDSATELSLDIVHPSETKKLLENEPNIGRWHYEDKFKGVLIIVEN